MIGKGGRFSPEEIGVVDLLQVLEGLAYVGFIAGAMFAVIELRTMSRDRKTEIVLRTAEFWCTHEFEEASAKFVKAKFKTPGEAEEQITLPSLMMMADYFDLVGFMVKRNLVPKNLVLDIMPCDYVWDKMKPWALGDDINDPRIREYTQASYRYFEWLAEEKRRRRSQLGNGKMT